MSRDVIKEIENEIKENTIMLYMKGTPDQPMCGFSFTVVEILNQVGKPYASVNILADQEKREAIKQFSNWPTIPQLYIKGEFIGGCDITREMFENGELQQMVDQAVAAQV
ncbi:monothiol glutaredoxin, Grx4 family [bacterium (Candidatus Blackallbacteria) CG17_big_fil_post_rev_8_21_14_2_50_48_46]|uniref:Glutaredoxin n=1 Tax=bacterium (Candidatus Blackallbacteria) CG17_big_fil_post_rev_8_21_14_2_50_48_46 TaxID=2014261 RepID=A0A2M7GAK9_9BACT|nr:MAG: monothiol glutaredoxin, Grx4 family [bacterium (Candidatus Blackallbacteria) CG18_big_fil_WC_8_21_14_2_50_49_26]PIW19193.1 MAG: monothiol glutaredoxin, Grx4 family [bacterium (Candidatus Blackallbacteria) CG17_big_fil_post_rev_8_21_14_2_50_48_46]PIW45457.1 MAG: monothiol glutaredoxin, Grx4 family [bacterium (Candidatus Blackallbacteria) CG13_big_fil_rev_8_21_14_2_50_49_14]